MHDPEVILKGKCITCYTRGNLQHYAGRFISLNASICANCAERQAEPLSLVLLWAAARGGPEACGPAASSWVSYWAHDYIGWPEIVALYHDSVESMIEILETELGPEIASVFKNPSSVIKH